MIPVIIIIILIFLVLPLVGGIISLAICLGLLLLAIGIFLAYPRAASVILAIALICGLYEKIEEEFPEQARIILFLLGLISAFFVFLKYPITAIVGLVVVFTLGRNFFISLEKDEYDDNLRELEDVVSMHDPDTQEKSYRELRIVFQKNSGYFKKNTRDDKYKGVMKKYNDMPIQSHDIIISEDELPPAIRDKLRATVRNNEMPL